MEIFSFLASVRATSPQLMHFGQSLSATEQRSYVSLRSRMEGPHGQLIKSCIYPRRQWQTMQRARPHRFCRWGAYTNWSFLFLARLSCWNYSNVPERLLVRLGTDTRILNS